MNHTFDASLIHGLAEAADQHCSGDFSGPLLDAINALMAASVNDGKDVMAVICDELPKLSSPHGAGMLAVWLGAMVEGGHAAAVSFPSVRDTFLRWAATIQTQEDDVAKGPDGAFLALENCGRSLVSHCSRDEPTMAALRADEALVEEVKRLEHDSNGAMWLMQLIAQMSAELVVLNVEKQEGALVKYENISNCFHLFTLLQGVLGDWLPSAKRPSEALMDCARGLGTKGGSDEARWHYTQPDQPETELTSWIWGEANPATIRTIDGQQVMILRPKVLGGRSWDAGFFGPQLQSRPPDVKLRHFFSPDEFLKWKTRLQLPDRAITKAPAPAEKKAWWKFW